MSDLHDRRTFLAALGTAALGLRASLGSAARWLEARKLQRVGLQLYTVRDAMKNDLPGTLSRVAKIGYREVEFAGYFGRSPNEIRGLLKRLNLTSPSSHVGFTTSDDQWRKTLDDAKTAGHQYVTIAWIPEESRGGVDEYRRIADNFNRLGTAAKSAGLRLAYHNHDYELKKVAGDALPLDVLLEHTDPALVDYEMDLYWMVKGGADPIDYMGRYPGRFAMVHVKDATAAPALDMMDVGKGTIDFPRIFAYDADHGKHIAHAFVEHDQPKDPLASAKASYEYLHKMSY